MGPLRKALCSAALLQALVTATAASSKEVNLVCDIKSTFDELANEMKETTGQDALSIVYDGEDMQSITLPFACDYGTEQVNISDASIQIGCEKEISPDHIVEIYVSIDRISGEYRRGISIKGAKGGLVHFGQCRITERLF